MEHISLYLKDIHFHRKSGRLVFRHQDILKYLFFQDGFLIHAKTNQKQELLGEVLFHLGRISEEDHKKIDEFIEPGQNLGEILVEKGIISRKDLYDGLIYQMREIALNMFPFFGGEFKFQETGGSLEKTLETKIDVATLIEDGIRRMKYDPTLQDFMARRVPVLKSRKFFYHLTEEEKEVFGLVDGLSRAEKLLPPSKLSPEIFWKDLFLLYSLDLVDFVGEAAPSREEQEVNKEEDIDQRLKEVMALSENISRMNLYQILDVSPSASKEEIKKSYFNMARRYHPDLFNRKLSTDEKQNIEQVFSSITKAYRTLIDEAGRKDYDSKMSRLSPEGKRDAAKKAETKFRQAKTLYNRGMYEDAIILLEEATRLVKDKGSYFLLLALTESRLPAYHKRAEDHFLRAIKLDPWNAEAHAGLGLLYKKAGLVIKARKQFEKTLNLDPDHPIARKELGHAEKKKKKKGLKDILSMDIFGKKK